jgi:hypothetical protein
LNQLYFMVFMQQRPLKLFSVYISSMAIAATFVVYGIYEIFTQPYKLFGSSGSPVEASTCWGQAIGESPYVVVKTRVTTGNTEEPDYSCNKAVSTLKEEDMPSSSSAKAQVSQARFIFKGTVDKLHAASMSSVPVSDRTIVVRVDEVIQSPPMLSGYVGKQVTVQVREGSKLQVGEQIVFHTIGWLYGKGIALQAVDHAPVEDITVSPKQPRVHPAQILRDQDLKEHMARAHVIVVGRVSDIRMAKLAIGSQGISHKNPQWQEASIQVETVLKGRLSQQEVVVVFPGSTDIGWHTAPKFRVGQEGIWILNQGETEGLGQPYFALHPLAFQPKHEINRIKTLLEGNK